MSSKPQRPSPRKKSGWPLCARWISLLAGGSLVAAIIVLFEHFIRARPENGGGDSRAQAAGESQTQVFGAYAGSAACRECHRVEFDLWANSNHALAERSIEPERDRAAFVPSREIRHGRQISRARMRGEEYGLITAGLSSASEWHAASRVIGNNPLRQFLTLAPGGRWQALELAYDPRRNEWFDVYGKEDRQPGEWGHWTGRGMNWNSMCAACHNTRLRKNYDPAADAYHTAMAEPSVGCEACHGPMRAHVRWRKNYPNRPEPAARRFGPDQILETCGSCHSRRMELTGDFQPGDSYFDHYVLAIPDQTGVYYADGQVHEEDYEFASFLGSRMRDAGVRCLDCHDPHSGRRRLPGNALCMRCHNGSDPKSPRIDPLRHSFHPPGSAGDQCVNCHMPQTVYMQRHARRDHGFTIPDPLLTVQYGIPNACNRCHSGQTAVWALTAVEKWHGAKMERWTRRRAQIIAAARAGRASGPADLLKLLQEDPSPYWKAVAASLLEPWLGDPRVTSNLLRLFNGASPLARSCAARSLAPLAEAGRAEAREALRNLLSDRSRSVRFNAAWALRAELEANSLAGRDFVRALEYNSDQPAGQLQLGVFAQMRGDAPQALACLQKAVRWDPQSPPFHEELAVILSVLERPREAMAEMQRACRLSPGDAEYQYRLGLACHEAGETNQALAALQKAVQLDPRHARAWFNLGLLEDAAGRSDSAIDALARAESADARDPNFPYARALILARRGDLAAAKNAARRALELNRNFRAAQELLESLR